MVDGLVYDPVDDDRIEALLFPVFLPFDPVVCLDPRPVDDCCVVGERIRYQWWRLEAIYRRCWRSRDGLIRCLVNHERNVSVAPSPLHRLYRGRHSSNLLLEVVDRVVCWLSDDFVKWHCGQLGAYRFSDGRLGHC